MECSMLFTTLFRLIFWIVVPIHFPLVLLSLCRTEQAPLCTPPSEVLPTPHSLGLACSVLHFHNKTFTALPDSIFLLSSFTSLLISLSLQHFSPFPQLWIICYNTRYYQSLLQFPQPLLAVSLGQILFPASQKALTCTFSITDALLRLSLSYFLPSPYLLLTHSHRGQSVAGSMTVTLNKTHGLRRSMNNDHSTQRVQPWFY